MSESKQEKAEEAKSTVSIEGLIARADELRASIEALDTAINTYLSHYRELQLSIETIKNLEDKSVEGYIILDRLSSVMIPAKITDSWHNNLLVNLGLGYYLKTNKEKALEILGKRAQNIEKLLNELQSRRRVLANEYLNIQRALSQLVQAERPSQE